MKVLCLLRHPQFSPNSVGKDRDIMTAVATRLRQQGHEVTVVQEEDTTHWQNADCDCVLTMGRLPQTLQLLKQMGTVRIINTPEGVARCARSTTDRLMRQIGTPAAPKQGDCGYWLKRGDACAQQKGDVVFACDEQELVKRIGEFRGRGIGDYVVTAHVEGDLVKFYGVSATGFFRYFYPTDDGQTKFGDEVHNGEAHHYGFDAAHLQQEAERLAEAVGIAVYGGDCIVRNDGSLCIIDFNDWPSFSRCRDEAAEAIVRCAQDEKRSKRLKEC